jgi:hypothetical protein
LNEPSRANRIEASNPSSGGSVAASAAATTITAAVAAVSSASASAAPAVIGFLNRNLTTVNLSSIEFLDCLLAGFAAGELDESKAARLTGVTVGGDAALANLAMVSEQST